MLIKKSDEVILDPSPGRAIARHLQRLNKYVIGQDRAKKAISRMLLRRETGLCDPRRPVGIIYLLGPTGVGKTELIKATASMLYGSINGYTHISCTSFKHGHEVTKLLGSPPSYVGYDQEPVLTQRNIDSHDKKYNMARIVALDKKIEGLEKSKNSSNYDEKAGVESALQVIKAELVRRKRLLEAGGFSSLILFDEFEKGHPDMHEILLEILNEGSLGLNDGSSTKFTNSIIALTGNVDSYEIQKIIGGSRIGFHGAGERGSESINREIYRAVLARVKKTMPPELLGRIGKEDIIVCKSLNFDETLQVLELQLKKLREYIAISNKPFTFVLTKDAKRFLVEESRDDINISLGARALLNGVKRRLFDSINILLSKDEDENGINENDTIMVRLSRDKKLEFIKNKNTKKKVKQLLARKK